MSPLALAQFFCYHMCKWDCEGLVGMRHQLARSASSVVSSYHHELHCISVDSLRGETAIRCLGIGDWCMCAWLRTVVFREDAAIECIHTYPIATSCKQQFEGRVFLPAVSQHSRSEARRIRSDCHVQLILSLPTVA